MSAVKLVKAASSYQVRSNGRLIAGIPFRFWEPCQEHGGVLTWESREPTRSENRYLKSVLATAIAGPADTLESRLVGCMERLTNRREEVSVAVAEKYRKARGNLPKVLTRPPVKLPNRYTGSYYTRNTRPVLGRPSNLPPVYGSPQTTFSVADAELTAGYATRRALRIVAWDTVSIFDIAPTVERLNLTKSIVRELCWEYQQDRALHYATDWQREQLARWESWQIRSEHYEPKRNFTPEQIAAECERLVEPPIRKHPVGACFTCVDWHGKQPVRLHLHRCPHTEVTFSFTESGTVIRERHSAEEFLKEIRQAAPTTGPKLPAWPGYVRQGRRRTSYSEDGTSYAAKLAQRYLGGKRKPITDRQAALQDFYGVMAGPNGLAKFQANAPQLLRIRAA